MCLAPRFVSVGSLVRFSAANRLSWQLFMVFLSSELAGLEIRVYTCIPDKLLATPAQRLEAGRFRLPNPCLMTSNVHIPISADHLLWRQKSLYLVICSRNSLLLYYTKVHCRVHKSQSFSPTPSHNFIPFSFKTHFNIIPPSSPTAPPSDIFLRFSYKYFVCILDLSHACYMIPPDSAPSEFIHCL
jgi:hypothetical protein